MRLRGFLKKEILQIRRDPSSLLLGIVMPVVLLFIFGYGVSLDPEDVPVAVVLEDRGPEARDLAARFILSDYFRPVFPATMQQATEMVRRQETEVIVRVRDDFSGRLARDGIAPVQLVVNGVDANRARLIQGYVRGALATWRDARIARGEPAAEPAVAVRERIWFNQDADSTRFLVPGLLTLVMTLTGTLLTALVIAREWERGTMEAILATPLRPGELLIGKFLPYFMLGMSGMALSVALSVALFDVPLRGSLVGMIVLSALFMTASIGLGLVISAKTRTQFVAAMVSVMAGFLPAFFLSGLLFDLQSTPAVIQAVSHLIPARYFVSISHTLFLAGDIGAVLLPAAGVLALMSAVLLGIARRLLPRRLPVQ
jgi:ABC-2 type transport system permease protein